ncbi:MAG: GGDEF domain-containing protein [Christensenellales bacterium]
MSIKIKLTLVSTAVSLLMVLFCGIIFFSVMRASIKTEMETKAKQTCNEAVLVLEKIVYADINILRTAAMWTMFSSSGSFMEENISRLQEYIDFFEYEYMLLVSPKQTYKIAKNMTSIIFNSEPVSISSTGDAFYGQPYEDEQEGLVITEPVWNKGQLSGLIVAKRPARWLWGKLASSLSLINENIIVSRINGEVLYPSEMAGVITDHEKANGSDEMVWSRININNDLGQGNNAVSVLAKDISLYVTAYVEPHQIDDQLNKYVLYYIILIVCGMLFIAIIVYILSCFLTKSIAELATYVEKSQTVIKEMPEKLMKQHDEVGILPRSFATLMNRLAVSMKKKEYMAYHDSLTHLKNRYKMEQDIARMISEKKPFAYALLDIDDFKTINDIHGHAEGDQLLTNIASVLKSLISKDLNVYRWGGDEFVLIISESKDFSGEILDKVLWELQNKLKIYKGKIFTASIGVCRYPYDAQTYKKLLIAADKALSKAKQQGKNRYCYF